MLATDIFAKWHIIPKYVLLGAQQGQREEVGQLVLPHWGTESKGQQNGYFK
jgi:hypothetical protein